MNSNKKKKASTDEKKANNADEAAKVASRSLDMATDAGAKNVNGEAVAAKGSNEKTANDDTDTKPTGLEETNEVEAKEPASNNVMVESEKGSSESVKETVAIDNTLTPAVVTAVEDAIVEKEEKVVENVASPDPAVLAAASSLTPEQAEPIAVEPLQESSTEQNADAKTSDEENDANAAVSPDTLATSATPGTPVDIGAVAKARGKKKKGPNHSTPKASSQAAALKEMRASQANNSKKKKKNKKKN